MAVNDVDLDQIIAAVEADKGADTPLERVAAARAVAGRLEAFSQHVVAHYVDAARRDGASWTDIGAALGVTRQAAQQRFVPADGVDVEAAVDAPALPLTVRATAALPAARDLALAHHHRGVAEIHLLLALLDNRSGGAIGVVKGLGHKSADLRKVARTHLGPDGPRRSSKNPPLERGTAKALDVAARESLRLGGTAVGTEHLLLALVSDPASAAGKALGDAGLSYAGVRGAVAGQGGGTDGRAGRKRSKKGT